MSIDLEVVCQSPEFDITEFITDVLSIGEIDVTSVDDLVRKVKGRALESCAYVARLDIYAHGTPNYISVGSDVIHAWRPQDSLIKLRSLKGIFDPSGIITFYVCQVGQSEQLIHQIAEATGIGVQANKGDVRPGLGMGFGNWFIAWPDGADATGQWGLPPY